MYINTYELMHMLPVYNYRNQYHKYSGREEQNSSMNSEIGRRLSETKTQMGKCLEIIQVF